MSDHHKAALAEGRTQGRAVRAYLEALAAHRPKRGRKRTAESIEGRLASLDRQLENADPLTALHLRQERSNLRRELDSLGAGIDLARLEAEFIAAARPYGERKGITYAVWRESGVPVSVLTKAGIGRSTSPRQNRGD